MDRSHIDYQTLVELRERVRLAEALILELSEHLATANALIAKLASDYKQNSDEDILTVGDAISAE